MCDISSAFLLFDLNYTWNAINPIFGDQDADNLVSHISIVIFDSKLQICIK